MIMTSGRFLSALQDHGLSHGIHGVCREDGTSSFDWDVQIQDWILEHLHTDTVLTTDELNFYEELLSSGELSEASRGDDLEGLEGLSEFDVSDAIHQLEQSTVAIQKQTALLKIQQSAVTNLIAASNQSVADRYAVGTSQRSARAARIIDVDQSLRAARRSIVDGFSLVAPNPVTLLGPMASQASDAVEEQDHLISRLQKLVARTVPGPINAYESSESIQKLGASLIKHAVEGVRAKLDNVFLQHVDSDVYFDGCGLVEDSQIRALREEVDSLYSELLPLAQMSVEQRFLQRSLRGITAQSISAVEKSQTVLDYVIGCITNMTCQLNESRHALSLSVAHEMATGALGTLLTEIAADHDQQCQDLAGPKKGTDSTQTVESSKRLASRYPQNQSRHPYSVTNQNGTSTEQQIVRSLGIPAAGRNLREPKLVADLARIGEGRRTKASAAEALFPITFETSIKEHRTTQRGAHILLHNSLQSSRGFKSATYVDLEVHAAIGELNQELQEVDSRLMTVDLETLRVRNVRRENFTARWLRP